MNTDYVSSTRFGGGYETNVYLSHQMKKPDSFINVGQDLSGRTIWRHRNRIYMNFNFDGRYFISERNADDQWIGFSLENVTSLRKFHLGISDFIGYSDQKAVDEEGRLLPRKRYTSFYNRARAYVEVEPHNIIGIRIGYGYRYMNYWETADMDSLDNNESAGDLSIWCYPWKGSILMFDGTYAWRGYREKIARTVDGPTSNGNPTLSYFIQTYTLYFRQSFNREHRLKILNSMRFRDDRFQGEGSYYEYAPKVIYSLLIRERVKNEVYVGYYIRRYEKRRSLDGEDILREDNLTVEDEVSYRLSRRIDIFLSLRFENNDSNDEFYQYRTINLMGGIIVYM